MHAEYFALLSLLTASVDYSECGWGIPHILPRMWISVTGSRTTTLAAIDFRLGRYVFTHIPFQRRVKQFHLNMKVEDCTSFRSLDEDGGVSALTSLVMFRSSACRTGPQAELNIRVQNQPVQLLQHLLAWICNRNSFFFLQDQEVHVLDKASTWLNVRVHFLISAYGITGNLRVDRPSQERG